MKKYFIAALLAGFIAFGCSKQSANAPGIVSPTGTWRYIGFSGGLAGFPFTPVDNAENYLQVDSVNSRILVNNGGQQACSHFTFEKSPAANYGLLTIEDSIMFTHKFDASISHDTLTLYPHGFSDAFEAHYIIVSKSFDWCSSSGIK